MRRSIVVWFALSLLVPGCGLALDYDPPHDGGSTMDGAIDSGSGCAVACEDNTECIEGSCLHPCSSTSECHFDDSVCEICDVSIGACVPSDASCDGGCAAVCDPVEDRCRANCPMGESCVDTECVEGIPCTTPSDCPATSTGCGFECTGGFCQTHLELACPGTDEYECATLDRCTSCDPIVISDACDDTHFCDVDGATFRCIECSDSVPCPDGAPVCDGGTCRTCEEDRECATAGMGAACVSNHCVECGSAADCEATGMGGACVANTCRPCDEDIDCPAGATPVCDLGTNQCVACVRAADCGAGQVCRLLSHTCGLCTNDTDCGGARCESGTCRRNCSERTECPVTCAGSATACTAGRCVYPAPSTAACNDESPCTEDTCVPNDGRANAFGCLFTPQHDRCADAFGCTDDRCVLPGTAGGPAACVHTPSNTICRAGISGSAARCIEPICLPDGAGHDSEGCVPSYVRPCAPGQVCRMDGTCEAVTRCSDCVDDGFACNGAETCALGLCTQIFTSSGGGCTGNCDQYCSSNTTCMPIPGAPDITCRLAALP